MNLAQLIRHHPLLHADLCSLGLSSGNILTVADQISAQLGTVNGNLSQVLEQLDRRSFVHAVDAKRVALDAGISPALAQASVFTIAPWVERFRPTIQ